MVYTCISAPSPSVPRPPPGPRSQRGWSPVPRNQALHPRHREPVTQQGRQTCKQEESSQAENQGKKQRSTVTLYMPAKPREQSDPLLRRQVSQDLQPVSVYFPEGIQIEHFAESGGCIAADPSAFCDSSLSHVSDTEMKARPGG